MITVEEAGEELYDAANTRWPDGSLDWDVWKKAVASFILAVQAEMPCDSRWCARTYLSPVQSTAKEPPGYCPSCTARRKLAEMEVPA